MHNLHFMTTWGRYDDNGYFTKGIMVNIVFQPLVLKTSDNTLHSLKKAHQGLDVQCRAPSYFFKLSARKLNFHNDHRHVATLSHAMF